MKMIKIKCTGIGCAVKDIEETIPAGRPVAPHVTEKYNTLLCDLCGCEMFVEPA